MVFNFEVAHRVHAPRTLFCYCWTILCVSRCGCRRWCLLWFLYSGSHLVMCRKTTHIMYRFSRYKKSADRINSLSIGLESTYASIDRWKSDSHSTHDFTNCCYQLHESRVNTSLSCTLLIARILMDTFLCYSLSTHGLALICDVPKISISK